MGTTVEALERLYRERGGALHALAASVTRDDDAARDVVQEAFARAIRARGTFRGESSLWAWVSRIAIRVALERRARPSVVHASEGALDGIVDTIDVALPYPLRDPELAAAVRRLSPKKRLIVFLRYFADLSYEDIASVCGVAPGTVSAVLTQARQALAVDLGLEKETLRAQRH